MANVNGNIEKQWRSQCTASRRRSAVKIGVKALINGSS
jgi:hypothetical protein